jgi:hypothetical protein
MRALLAVLLVAAAAAGSALAASAFTRHHVPGTAASVSLPGDWRTLTRSQVLNSALPAGVKQNPQLAPILRALRSSTVLRFFAFDPQIRNGFATNVNVLATSQPGLTFDQFARQLAYELDHDVGGLRPLARPGHRRIQLPAGPALISTMRLRVNVQGAALVASIRQYGLLHGGRGYVFTFSTLQALAGRYAPVFERAARSIRFS